MHLDRNRACRALALALAAAVLAGCQTAAPVVRKPSVVIDPCAERLHDVCGRLLLYHAAHKALPESLADLQGPDDQPPTPMTCPASGEPYVYNREGLLIPGRPGRLVLYDPLPHASGMRWGVFAEIADGNQPLAARVILLPESAFSARK